MDPYNGGMLGLWRFLHLWDFGTFSMVGAFILLAIDFFFLDRKRLGLGTFIGMFLGGYVVEFSHWFYCWLLPEPCIIVWIVFLAMSLILLCFSSSMYYVANFGVASYDCIALTISERAGWMFKFVRITSDCLCIVTGLLGRQLPGIATVVVALFLGPLIEAFTPLNQQILNGRMSH